jgi:hypothetical protein
VKPLGKVKIKWSPDFAYAIGLLTTDGNLSPDSRHINFTSKDKELINIFKKCLELSNRIGRKARGGSKEKKYYVIQFGDVIFYRFLLNIGLKPNKSKSLGELFILDKYFFDFLRGHFDGDGSFYSYWDPRWKSSFMFYTVFISASKNHIDWLRQKIFELIKIKGHITKGGKKICYQLKYAKKESLRLLKKMYYSCDIICLSRKRLKIKKALSIIGKEL